MDTIDITPEFTIPDKKELRQKIDQLNLAYDLAFSVISSMDVVQYCIEGMALLGDQAYRVRAVNAMKELQSALYDFQTHIGTELGELTSTLDVMEGKEPGGDDER